MIFTDESGTPFMSETSMSGSLYELNFLPCGGLVVPLWSLFFQHRVLLVQPPGIGSWDTLGIVGFSTLS